MLENIVTLITLTSCESTEFISTPLNRVHYITKKKMEEKEELAAERTEKNRASRWQHKTNPASSPLSSASSPTPTSSISSPSAAVGAMPPISAVTSPPSPKPTFDPINSINDGFALNCSAYSASLSAFTAAESKLLQLRSPEAGGLIASVSAEDKKCGFLPFLPLYGPCFSKGLRVFTLSFECWGSSSFLPGRRRRTKARVSEGFWGFESAVFFEINSAQTPLSIVIIRNDSEGHLDAEKPRPISQASGLCVCVIRRASSCIVTHTYNRCLLLKQLTREIIFLDEHWFVIMMDPQAFVRLSIGSLALRIPVNPSSNAGRGANLLPKPSCTCEIRLLGFPVQTASVPLVSSAEYVPDSRMNASAFYLEKSHFEALLTHRCFRAGPSYLEIVVYSGRQRPYCGLSGGKQLIGRFRVVVGSEWGEGRPALLHNGWISIGKESKGGSKIGPEMHLRVKLDPDPRYVFQFEDETALSPQIVQFKGNSKQPIFSCKYSQERR
ncbi:hypothetical protein AXF42_Ash006427 [Apostasia shenzhenica]|uniref:Uncharacterized protein n=1 Tax=Apostasia shenzhenica TaxID=1088818 RepID=A0A2I0AZ18_9ASPA|nr:hypothetical protein AXF42_Ash006427 [Apostasia shenzhenica]